MENLNGKVVVVTGAASGIGKALAKTFLAQGMKVVLSDIDEKRLKETEKELADTQGELISVVTDVSLLSDVTNLAEKTLEKFGAVHVLCNNAGIGFGNGLTWENSLDDWNWVLGVNLMGVIHGIKTFVPIMDNQGDECFIINTASTAGILTGSGSSPYAVSKHGVVALSECLYNDLVQTGKKINVSVLCPGFVHTDILDPLRSRPNRFETFTPGPLSPELKMISKAFVHAVESGMKADLIGAIVLQAMKDKLFYILTHDDTLELVKKRFEGIMQNTNPLAELPKEFAEYFGKMS